MLCCRTDLLTSMLPKYKALLDYDLSILVFSGDVDAIVPVSCCLTSYIQHVSDIWSLTQNCRSAPILDWCSVQKSLIH